MSQIKRLTKSLSKRKKVFFLTALAIFLIWILVGSQLWIKPGFTARVLISSHQPSADSLKLDVSSASIKALLYDTQWVDRLSRHPSQLFRDSESIEQFRSGLMITDQYDDGLMVEIIYTDTREQQTIDKLKILTEAIVKDYQSRAQKKIRENIDYLMDQLLTATTELESAEKARRDFKKEHPWVGLQGDAVNAIQNTSYLQAQKLKLENDYERLKYWQSKYTESDSEPNPEAISEISGLIGASAEKFNRQHFADQMDSLLTAWSLELKSLEARLAQERVYKFRQLPEKQATLAELDRRHAQAEKKYTALADQYKQVELQRDGREPALRIAAPPAIIKSLSPGKAWLIHGLIGLGAALLLSLLITIIPQAMKGVVQDESDIENSIALPVLIKIPEIGDTNGRVEGINLDKNAIDPKLITADFTPSSAGEAFRNLRIKILFGNGEESMQSLFITSTTSGEGKSLSAANIAITIAQQKIQTLLVDADLRRGLLHNLFGLDKEPGFSDFLYSQADVTEKNMKHVIRKTHVPNLFLLTAGKPIPNPAEMVGSKRFKDMMAYFVDRFGFVLLDTPPIAIASDAYIISNYLDTGLLVVRQGLTQMRALRYRLLEYPDFVRRFKGILLNYADLKEVDTQSYSYYNY